ncbi:MAG TPA: M14 metallopeptidase family protein, partial [Bryobacteraceae bacterium]|nr:M14 metallopeptidase family protein [Bryobacteraceae bacterium]
MPLRLILLAGLLARFAVSAVLPAPEQFFGHKIGADRTVLDWDRVVAYFRALESGGASLRVSEVGRSTEGRPFIAVLISSPQTLRDLERYRGIQEKLADPRLTSPAESAALIAGGKAVVMITCSIHSTELASTHTAVEFTYRLLTEKSAKFDAILRETIFILVPSLNPDGLDLVTRWYRKTVGTPFEGTEPPELYHKYVGHDNNRDWYIFSQQETRLTISQLQNVWHPQIVYDVHQMGRYGSRMFVPPWLDPIEPNIDPVIVQQCNSFGAGMAADLTAAGKTGIAINAMYDFWTPARHYQAYHGGLRILTESASARLASPVAVLPEQILRTAHGYNPREKSWNHLEPWLGGEWRLRDIIDYQEIAWESLLFQAAVRREDLLRNFYNIGLRALARSAPYAFVVPERQPDPGATRKLLETLAFGEVEIERAEEAFRAGGIEYPAGSYVIRLAQPYGAFAKTLLERQRYPDLRQYPGGPPRRPYDVTAHTLPLLMGVDVDQIAAPFNARLTRATRFDPPAGTPAVLPAGDTATWPAVNRIWKTGASVWRDPRTGDFHRSAGGGSGLKEIRRPRLGLYRSYQPSIDEGWTRWLLEQFG